MHLGVENAFSHAGEMIASELFLDRQDARDVVRELGVLACLVSELEPLVPKRRSS
jgi:hypothetical protein